MKKGKPLIVVGAQMSMSFFLTTHQPTNEFHSLRAASFWERTVQYTSYCLNSHEKAQATISRIYRGLLLLISKTFLELLNKTMLYIHWVSLLHDWNWIGKKLCVFSSLFKVGIPYPAICPYLLLKFQHFKAKFDWASFLLLYTLAHSCGEEWCYKMIGKIREAGSRRGIIWTESGIDTRPLHASGFYYERSAQYLSAAKSCRLLLRGAAEAELKPWPLLKSERHGACHQIHLPAAASHPSIL